MFIRKCDLLSPPITLFFKGEEQHSTIFAGILSIIAYGAIFAFGIYYSLEFINKENPNSFFFNRYVEDAGYYPVNASSMFHFLETIDTDTSTPRQTDFDAFRIIGLEEFPDVYIRNNDLSNYDHWLYGPCNNNSDTQGIGYLINFKKFEQNACIKKFYDKNKNNYFEVSNKNFRWPLVAKGVSNPEEKFYGVIMEKCRNDELRTLSGAGECKTIDQINGIIGSSMINFYIVDNYADVLNYKKPFRKYLYSISSGIYLGSIVQNNLNFNPVTMKTHNGIFFENVVNQPAYFFSQNEKVTTLDEVTNENGGLVMVNDEHGNQVPKTTGIILCFYFWMQNRMQYYERSYKRLQDILGDIGGLSSIVLLFSQLLNYLSSYYIILLHTEELFISFEEKNYGNERKSHRTPTIFRKAQNLMNYPPRKQSNNSNQNEPYENGNNQALSSHYQNLIRDDINIWKNVKNDGGNSYSPMKKKKKSIIKIVKRKKLITPKTSSLSLDSRKEKSELKELDKNTNDGSNKAQNNIILDRTRTIKKAGFTFIKYIWYFICCKRNNQKIDFYIDFRTNLISEENIVQDHYDIYHLKEICGINKNGIYYFQENKKEFIDK